MPYADNYSSRTAPDRALSREDRRQEERDAEVELYDTLIGQLAKECAAATVDKMNDGGFGFDQCFRSDARRDGSDPEEFLTALIKDNLQEAFERPSEFVG